MQSGGDTYHIIMCPIYNYDVQVIRDPITPIIRYTVKDEQVVNLMDGRAKKSAYYGIGEVTSGYLGARGSQELVGSGKLVKKSRFSNEISYGHTRN